MIKIFDKQQHLKLSWKRILRVPEFIYDQLKIKAATHLRPFYYTKHNMKDKKLLGVWNFYETATNGGRIGDFLSFLQALNVLEESSCGVYNVDICIIDDKSHPNLKKQGYVKTYNHRKELSSLTNFLDKIDTVYHFKSEKQFDDFFEENKSKYIRFPLKNANPYDQTFILDHFIQHHFDMPHLTVPKEILSEVYEFHETHTRPGLPIVLNIRNNPYREQFKNTDIDLLEGFLKYYECGDKYNEFKFIIICGKSEIPDRLRKLKNVIFSKDHFDSLEYDLALIQSAFLFIGFDSGITLYATYTGTPLLSLWKPRKYTYSDYFVKRGYSFFDYYKDIQKIFNTNKEQISLIKEFEKMITYLDKNHINNHTKNYTISTTEYGSLF